MNIITETYRLMNIITEIHDRLKNTRGHKKLARSCMTNTALQVPLIHPHKIQDIALPYKSATCGFRANSTNDFRATRIQYHLRGNDIHGPVNDIHEQLTIFKVEVT